MAGAAAQQRDAQGFPLSQQEIVARLNSPGTGVPASPNVLGPASGSVSGGGPGSVYNVGPQGQTSYSVTPNTQSYDAEQARLASQREQSNALGLLDERARLNTQSTQQRLAALSSLSGSAPAHVSSGSVPFDEEGARNVAFARAKDTAGQTALSSLKALQDVVDSRGLNGSTIESGDTARILGQAGGSIGSATRDQLLADLTRASQISDRNYQGDISQRGQDIAAQQSLYALLNSAGTVY